MVKALHCNGEVPGDRFPVSPWSFPWLLRFPCALVSNQILTVSTRINLGVKVGRSVRLTTYHFQVTIVKKSGGLNLLEPCGPVQGLMGQLYVYLYMQTELQFAHISFSAS